MDLSNTINKGATSGAAGNSTTKSPFGNIRPIKMKDSKVVPAAKLFFRSAIGEVDIHDVGPP